MAATRNLFGLGHKLQPCGRVTGAVNLVVPSRSSSVKTTDVVTHTGQKWDEDDYRMARFVDKRKMINPNWAVKLIDEVPPEKCKSRVVSCDGGGGPLGHPKVYINLDKPGNHICGYCGLRFYKEGHH